MAIPNLRKTPTPSPASAPEFRPPASGMPLVRNQVYTSDSTKKELSVAGWEEGDPIPVELAARLQQMQQQLQEQELAELRAKQPTAPTSIAPPKPKKLSEMPPAYQQEIANLLQQAKLHGVDVDALQNQPQGVMNPAISAAIKTLTPRMRQQTAPQVELTPPGPEIVDDMTDDESSNQKQPEEPSEAHTGSLPEHKECPRCRLDLTRPFSSEPDDDDRRRFMVALLSLQRFTKQMILMDGEMVITYRTLRADESRMVFTQLGHDNREGKNTSEAEYLMAMMDYRMALSIERIAARDGRLIVEMPDPAQLEFDPVRADGKPQTVVSPLLDWLITDGLPSEPMRRIVGQHHRQFQRLVEALEVQVAEPSFWNGIAPQH